MMKKSQDLAGYLYGICQKEVIILNLNKELLAL